MLKHYRKIEILVMGQHHRIVTNAKTLKIAKQSVIDELKRKESLTFDESQILKFPQCIDARFVR